MLEHVNSYYKKKLFSSKGINNFHLNNILDTITTFNFEEYIIQDMERDIE